MRNVRNFYGELSKENATPDFDHPYNVALVHRQNAIKILECFKQYNQWLLGRIVEFWKSNLPKLKDTETLKKKLLETISDQNREFVSALITTQQFTNYVSQ